MKRIRLLLMAGVLSALSVTPAAAEDSLDTLLPPPFWLRSRAPELGIDAATRERIEELYQSLEPEYHDLKDRVAARTGELNEALLDDDFDVDLIRERMQSLLEAETELKMYQVNVRLKLFAEVTPEQRRRAQELARDNPEPNVQAVMEAKVERVRDLSRQVSESGQSVAYVQERMQEVEQMIEGGKVVEAARVLDHLTRELEKVLDSE